MGIIQNSGAVHVNGNVSAVLDRESQQDDPEGWSITTRPYRPALETGAIPPEFLCNTGENTCYLAGNRVRMADGSQKAVERIKIGDLVLTMQGPDRVRALEQPKLGLSRKVIELRGLGDDCLVISDEHPLWVRRLDADGKSDDTWGTYNLNHLMYEMRNSIEPRLPSLPVPLQIDIPEQLAHETGWVHAQPIYHHLAPSTQLYNIATEKGCAVFVEGFAAFSHCLGSLTPANGWQGLSGRPAAQDLLRKLELHSA
ncbi:MAG: hypothetical protein ACLGJD_08030 [Gammaproteobacteria bacterium]|jgi:hypothetical protein|uniref:hypothetical protein n=1 Tax=Pseudacidovorax sp. TaxID=1934311 RepID=UPI001B609364|nr:hypothetical protein [Pseudacidovorax sp.]MBP6897157.1 hypothetical protein [Pseudacidovorax sp.]